MGRSYIKVLLISKAVLHGAKEDTILFVQWQKCFLNLMIISQSTIFFSAGRDGPIQQKKEKKISTNLPPTHLFLDQSLPPPSLRFVPNI